MYTLFYSNISEFAGDFKVMLDEETWKTSIWNIHKLVWKGNYFKYANVSILGHGCGVSQHPQFYERTKKYIKCYQFHMWEAIQVKRVTNFCKKIGLLH